MLLPPWVVSELDIDNTPTIEAEPVRHGEWIANEKDKPTHLFSCSECKWAVALAHYLYPQ